MTIAKGGTQAPPICARYAALKTFEKSGCREGEGEGNVLSPGVPLLCSTIYGIAYPTSSTKTNFNFHRKIFESTGWAGSWIARLLFDVTELFYHLNISQHAVQIQPGCGE